MVRHPTFEEYPLTGKLAWSASGDLLVGGSEGYTLQADFDTPDVYTIQFSITPPRSNEVGPSQLIKPQADIFWSVEGNFVRRIVSVVEGNAISGAGQGVKVKVYDWGAVADPFTFPTVRYQVSTQVVRGTRAANTNLPPVLNTISNAGDPNVRINFSSAILLNPGGTYTHLVLPHAGIQAVYFEARTNNPVDPPLQQNDLIVEQAVALIGTPMATYNYEAHGRWIPLYAGTTEVRYTNNGPVPLLVAPLWGVEG